VKTLQCHTPAKLREFNEKSNCDAGHRRSLDLMKLKTLQFLLFINVKNTNQWLIYLNSHPYNRPTLFSGSHLEHLYAEFWNQLPLFSIYFAAPCIRIIYTILLHSLFSQLYTYTTGLHGAPQCVVSTWQRVGNALVKLKIKSWLRQRVGGYFIFVSNTLVGFSFTLTTRWRW